MAKDKTTVARDLIADLEFSQIENGHPACPYCHAHKALDPENPREWETHAEDCRLTAALAALDA